jgi:hypothetical protein
MFPRTDDVFVMAGLVPAIYVFTLREKKEKRKTWMPGTRPGMTSLCASAIDSFANPGLDARNA